MRASTTAVILPGPHDLANVKKGVRSLEYIVDGLFSA